jgi:hypothetical protein
MRIGISDEYIISSLCLFDFFDNVIACILI